MPEQVDSILPQMGDSDELVIVDDASSDGTVAYLRSLRDSRIRIFFNASNLGHVQSFAKAIEFARGKYILMADQDDVWSNGRLQIMCDALSTGCKLISTNSQFIDRQGRSIPPLHSDLVEADSSQYLTNIAKIFSGSAYYYGCAMGMRDELRRLILPIPAYVESHDLWIAMAANIVRSNRHLPCYTLQRRVHGNNASVVSRPPIRKIISRFIFLLSFFHITLRTVRQALKFEIKAQ